MVIGAIACVLCAVAAFFTIDDRELKLKRGQDILDDSDAPPDAERMAKRDEPPHTRFPESP